MPHAFAWLADGLIVRGGGALTWKEDAMSSESFREFARGECRKAFGVPQVLTVPGGEIDRWTLKRPDGPEMYVTLDAPELEQIVHLLISDPGSTLVDPIASVVLRTEEELQEIIERINAQWACRPNDGG